MTENTNIIRLPKLDTEITISRDWIAERDKLVMQAKPLATIDSDGDYSMAGEVLSQITKTSNAMEKFRKDYSQPYLEAQRAIKRGADDAREPLEECKRSVQSAMSKYQAEQRRKAEEERKRIEAERQAEIEKQIAEADALGLEPEIEEPEPLPVVAAPRSNAVRVQKVITWEVVDEEQVPANLKAVDSVKVNGYKSMNKDRIFTKAESGGGEFVCLGIKWKVEDKIIAR